MPCMVSSIYESVSNIEIKLSVFTVVATSVEKKIILEGPFLSEGIKVVALDCVGLATCNGLRQKS